MIVNKNDPKEQKILILLIYRVLRVMILRALCFIWQEGMGIHCSGVRTCQLPTNPASHLSKMKGRAYAGRQVNLVLMKIKKLCSNYL